MKAQPKDFYTESRADWIQSIKSAVGSNTSTTIEWTRNSEIVDALSTVMGTNRNHSLLPEGGGLDFKRVQRSSEAGCIEFVPSERTVYRVKPKRLVLEVIEQDPAESFFLLELDRLQPSGAYDEPEGGVRRFDDEEYVETGRGELYPRPCWDEQRTPNGLPLPEDSQLVFRMFSGKVMVLAKASLWNGVPATYDGTHAKMTSSDIRSVIEKVLRRKK